MKTEVDDRTWAEINGYRYRGIDETSQLKAAQSRVQLRLVVGNGEFSCQLGDLRSHEFLIVTASCRHHVDPLEHLRANRNWSTSVPSSLVVFLLACLDVAKSLIEGVGYLLGYQRPRLVDPSHDRKMLGVAFGFPVRQIIEAALVGWRIVIVDTR